MAEKIEMPQLGESVVEGTIAEWFVAVGDEVDAGQTLVEVETDKANTEIPATKPGVIKAILVEEGETVSVGTPILELGEPGESDEGDDEPAEAADEAEPPADGGDDADDKDDGTKADDDADDDADERGEDKSADAEDTSSKSSDDGGSGQRKERRKAPEKDHSKESESEVERPDRPWNVGGAVAAPAPSAHPGLPLARPAGENGGEETRGTSAGSGGDRKSTAGRVASGGRTLPYGAPPGGNYYKPPTVKPGPDDETIPFSRRRGIIAEHMVYSKHVSPHVPCVAEVDMTAVVNLRRKHKVALREKGIPLTILSFVLKATTQALREFPGVNASVGAGEIIRHGHIHLGVAVETEAGLVVPVIRDADQLSVTGIATAVQDVATRARNKQISIDELTGGTFTVSNPGRKGNLFGAAIINQPQCGILRMGEIVRRPVVREVEGEEVICIRSMMYLALTYDHRIIDGVTGNGFLYRIGELLEACNFQI